MPDLCPQSRRKQLFGQKISTQLHRSRDLFPRSYTSDTSTRYPSDVILIPSRCYTDILFGIFALHAAFKQVKVVADGHGKGEQFLKTLLWFLELDCDAAWRKSYTGGEVLELLIHNGCSGFDQQLGMSDPLSPQVFDEVGHFTPALDLKRAFVSLGDALESGEKGITIGESVDTGATLENTGSHNLLGAPAADTEQELDGGAVYIRKRELTQLLHNVRQFTIPDRFGGHYISLCYCAPAQFRQANQRKIRIIILLSVDARLFSA